MPKRIALFTPFSPDTGGGAAIFRSLLPHLSGAETHWFYLSTVEAAVAGTTRLGPPVLGGPLARETWNSMRLFVLRRHPAVLAYAKSILAWSPDIVWVNGMNEGLLIGPVLRRLGAVNLHVSVHDDPAGLAQKSRRHRHLARLIDGCARELLRAASSVDVVSEPMQRYYKERYGVDAAVVYRYIDGASPKVVPPADASIIRVGHVGSAYSVPEVKAFLRALRAIEGESGVRFKVMTFGRSPFFETAAAEFPGLVEAAGDVPEDEAVSKLQQCRFVYSMYPFDRRYRIFRRTSQPTKMSTYLMAARPILAHCPPDSSIVAMMSRFHLGACVSSMAQNELVEGIRRILKFELDADDLRGAIDHHCGRRNLDVLESCFELAPIDIRSGAGSEARSAD